MITRPILVAGNWKMNHSREAAREFVREFTALWAGSPLPVLFAQDVLRGEIYAPLLLLETLQAEFRKHLIPVAVGAQNVHWEEKGAFTGETSEGMLKEIQVSRVLVGHSERRQLFGETDETVKKRTQMALVSGLEVILCIGETRAERESGQTDAVIERQLTKGLPDLWSDRLVIAYEPVWAIGTGLTATPEQAEQAHQTTRKILKSRYGAEAADKMLILYGGSVTPENAFSLFTQPNVDGGLVGGASLKAQSFFTLLMAAAKTLSARAK